MEIPLPTQTFTAEEVWEIMTESFIAGLASVEETLSDISAQLPVEFDREKQTLDLVKKAMETSKPALIAAMAAKKAEVISHAFNS